MLNILSEKDLDFLRIKKVKPWMILFDYKDKTYLIHENRNSDQLDFYEKEKIGIFGHYKLNYICSNRKFVSDIFIGNKFNIKSFFKNKNINIAYNHIDKNYFIFKLNETFCEVNTFYSEEIKQKFENVKKISKEIEEFKKIITQKETQINNLFM